LLFLTAEELGFLRYLRAAKVRRRRRRRGRKKEAWRWWW